MSRPIPRGFPQPKPIRGKRILPAHCCLPAVSAPEREVGEHYAQHHGNVVRSLRRRSVCYGSGQLASLRAALTPIPRQSFQPHAAHTANSAGVVRAHECRARRREREGGGGGERNPDRNGSPLAVATELASELSRPALLNCQWKATSREYRQRFAHLLAAAGSGQPRGPAPVGTLCPTAALPGSARPRAAGLRPYCPAKPAGLPSSQTWSPRQRMAPARRYGPRRGSAGARTSRPRRVGRTGCERFCGVSAAACRNLFAPPPARIPGARTELLDAGPRRARTDAGRTDDGRTDAERTDAGPRELPPEPSGHGP